MRTRHDDRPHDFLLEAEAADLLRLSRRTLQRHRQASTGPVYRRLGRRIVYAQTDLVLWAESCRSLSTAALVAA